MKPFPQQEKRAEEPPKETMTVKDAVARTAQAASAQLEHLGQEATRIKTAVASAVTDAVEDGKHAARRAIKHARVEAEDFVDETTLRVRRAPLQSVAIAFGAGALIGVALTIILRGRSRT